MASLAISESFLAVCSREKVIVSSVRGSVCLNHQLTNDEGPIDDEMNEENEVKKKPPRKEANHIVDCRFSPFEKYFAICSSDKMLLVWQTATWKLAYKRNIPRRPMKLLFCKNEDIILIADKTGDVYKFDLQMEMPEHVLGHLSVILDMTLCSDDKELITCDRDGKIRISCHPNCYNIEKFLMAHTSFVSSVALEPSGKYLLSVDGDGQLFLWDKESGKHLDYIRIKEEGDYIPRKVCIDKRHRIYVLIDGFKKVIRFEIHEGKIEELEDITLEHIPLDLICDDQNIIVLQQSSDQPLICYHINDEKQCTKLAKSTRMTCLSEIQQLLPEPMKSEPWICNAWADDQS